MSCVIHRHHFTMNREIQQRLLWVKLYETSGDAGFVCRRGGISRPTLRKWWRKYLAQGLAGLESHSRRHKVYHQRNRHLRSCSDSGVTFSAKSGCKTYSKRVKTTSFNLTGNSNNHKVLCQNQVKSVVKFRRKADFIRYEHPVPGDRVQMDTCKIGPALYQYTSLGDCTRYRVLSLYSRRTAANTLDFIDCVIEEMPFPIQRFQTDRGREFFVVKVQERLQEYGIKFRPNKPASPHLNGKVERSQKTDKALP